MKFIGVPGSIVTTLTCTAFVAALSSKRNDGVFSEPFYAGLTRKLSLSLPGASIARVEEGKVATWADYYDGLTSRRTALGAFFTEWVEY
jgi:limonene-1,2-epoxide hydrolase